MLARQAGASCDTSLPLLMLPGRQAGSTGTVGLTWTRRPSDHRPRTALTHAAVARYMHTSRLRAHSMGRVPCNRTVRAAHTPGGGGGTK